MFEKSLVDLIRGLRHHKGNEKSYIQERLRECRKEVKSQDMALKATALLKLTYLEMFGYDMSWVSFNVLEVMSSSNYSEKKVGYLAAIQSFRPDTEVLMLAENLLKKDLMSPSKPTIALPLAAIPHVVNPSMANSLLSELLPRLNHSDPSIRKKAVVILYRLALVYPETLRPAWPKIKERLLDEDEHPSVTAAIANVVCELGWRRPQDFLPLAPRLFEILVETQNNWMAIKIIKLFATLTHLEPRLVKKLLPPLTKIIKTTPAMSLLYEAIHGIVEGGLLASIEGTTEGDELARLCVGKLRNMVLIEGDPNLKFVALLAFEKIVASHPYLVSLHQDVILECIDDPDISIRGRALNLVVGMVNSENLTTIADRLLSQLLASPTQQSEPTLEPARPIDLLAESDEEEESDESLRGREVPRDDTPPLPDDYRIKVIRNILEMCAKDTYSNLNDFEWYIAVLVQLVKACPMVRQPVSASSEVDRSKDISYEIGSELQNIAVRVKSMRSESTIAAQSLILIDNRGRLFPSFSNGGQGVLEASGWLVGEYANELTDAEGVLNSFLHSSTAQLPANILSVHIQAMLKVLSLICAASASEWTSPRRANTTLLMNRVIYFLEPMSKHADLEIQELAVEYIELLKLASEASSAQPVSQDDEHADPPLLITQVIPSLFIGQDLNPVAPGAQQKVEVPADLGLDNAINEKLEQILQEAEDDALELEHDDMEDFYYKADEAAYVPGTAAERLDLASKVDPYSYQISSDDDGSKLARSKRRNEQNKDDPFYIRGEDETSKLHNIIKNSNGGESLDIDAIPIMKLDLSGGSSSNLVADREAAERDERRRKAAQRKKIDIVRDETLGSEEASQSDSSRSRADRRLGKKSLLNIDSSGLRSLSLDDTTRGSRLDIEQREEEERALREVERLRLEMQRASERIQAKEESVVKRKKKKTPKTAAVADSAQLPQDDLPGESEVVVKKKKKKAKANGEAVEDAGASKSKKKKKNKRREVDLTGPAEETQT